MNNQNLPSVGDQIKAIKGRYTDSYDNMIGTVTEIKYLGDTPIVMAKFLTGGPVTATIAVDEWEVIIPESEPSDWDTIATLTDDLFDAYKTIDSLKAEVQRLISAYRHDMGHWESTLRQAKDEENWCDDGTNRIIDILNSGFTGGWEIEPYRKLVEVEVAVEARVATRLRVYVLEGEDELDPDNWREEEGDLISDPEEAVYDKCRDELENYGWDYWEVQ